jgi:hypothetical protein
MSYANYTFEVVCLKEIVIHGEGGRIYYFMFNN